MLPLPSGKKQQKKKLTIDEFFKLVFKEKIIKFDKNFAELRFYNVVVLFVLGKLDPTPRAVKPY